MTSQKSQNSNMLLAFLTLLGVIVLVAVVGFFMLRKGPEIIQGQAEVTEYRVSSKVPGRILEFRVKEGQTVQAGDTLAILEAPDVMAKMEQARAAEAAAQAQNEKARFCCPVADPCAVADRDRDLVQHSVFFIA